MLGAQIKSFLFFLDVIYLENLGTLKKHALYAVGHSLLSKHFMDTRRISQGIKPNSNLYLKPREVFFFFLDNDLSNIQAHVDDGTSVVVKQIE